MTSNSIKPFRWYLKKTARGGMCLATLPSKRLLLSNNQSNSLLRVLTYHRFGNVSRDPFCIGLKDFQAQMDWIARQNLAVSLTDIESFLAGKKDIPRNAVLVTVDDGYRSLYLNALPILKQYSIPAVAFITTSNIDSHSQNNYSKSNETIEPYLTWKEVEALAEAGIAIGSHALTHRSLGKMSLDEAYQEAVMSRESIEKNLGINVTAFAYPFGTFPDFNNSTSLILKESGYKLAFTSQHGAIVPKLDPLTLPRIKVEGGEPMWMFRLLVSGGLDEWRLIDKMLWRLQQSP